MLWNLKHFPVENIYMFFCRIEHFFVQYYVYKCGLFYSSIKLRRNILERGVGPLSNVPVK